MPNSSCARRLLIGGFIVTVYGYMMVLMNRRLNTNSKEYDNLWSAFGKYTWTTTTNVRSTNIKLSKTSLRHQGTALGNRQRDKLKL